MINNDLFQVRNIQEWVLFPVITLSVFISVIWDTYFIKKIVHFVRIYQECMERAKTDPFGNFAEAARNYKVEVITNAFLLIMNITEFTTIVMYGVGSVPTNSMNFNSNYNESINGTVHDCSKEYFHTLDLELAFENPFFSILISFGKAGLLFSIALGICLVKYLHISYHELNFDSFKIIKRFLLITSLIGIFLIISGSIPQLMIIECLVEPIILFVYFCIWVKSNRTFYKTLQWRTMEYRIRGRSNCIVRRSIINCHQFLIISSCIGVALACILITQFLTQYFFLIATAIYDGPCLFQHLFGTSYYNPVLTTQNQIGSLQLSSDVFSLINRGLLIIVSALFAVEYVLASTFIFGVVILKQLKFRIYKRRTRFTPSLNDPLLFDHAN